MKKIVLLMCGLSFCQGLSAAYFVDDRHNSLAMYSAELLAPQQLSIDLSGFSESYKMAGQNTTDIDAYATAGLGYGLSDRLSLGLGGTMAGITADAQGLKKINLLAKLHLGGSHEEGIGVSIAAYKGLLVAPRTEGLGSGDATFGAMANISLYNESTTVHLSLGGEQTDLKQPGAGFLSDQVILLGGGLEYRWQPDWTLLVEGLFTRSNTEDDNLIVAPSLHYRPQGPLSYYARFAAGIPSDSSLPEYSAMAGIRYQFWSGDAVAEPQAQAQRSMVAGRGQRSDRGQQTAAIGQLSAPPAMVAQPVAELPIPAEVKEDLLGISQSQALLLQQLESMRSEMNRMATRPENALAKVEILNASGIEGLGEVVGRLLTLRGYSIASISDLGTAIEQPTQIYYMAGTKNAEIVGVDRARLGIKKQTRIYYIEGFEQRATRVSMVLPGSQRVMPDDQLQNQVQVRVVVGRDLKVLLQKKPAPQPAT